MPTGIKEYLPLYLDNRFPALYEMEELAGVLTNPNNLAMAARYDAWFSASNNTIYTVGSDQRVQAITSTGLSYTSIAGQAGVAGNANGTGTAASFSTPRGIVGDGLGNLFVADQGNGSVRVVTLAGVVTTLVTGLGTVLGIDISADKQYLFLGCNTTVKRVKISDASVTTLATAPAGANFYGVVYSARRNKLYAVSTDSINAGVNQGIYEIDLSASTPTPVLILGGNTVGGFDNSPGLLAKFNRPYGLQLGTNDVYLYVSEILGHRIRKFNLDTPLAPGITVVGNGTQADTPGTGTAASILGPGGLAFDATNATLYSVCGHASVNGKFAKVV